MRALVWLGIVVAVAILAVSTYGQHLLRKECEAYSRETGRVTEFKPRVGCLVQRGELWMIKN